MDYAGRDRLLLKIFLWLTIISLAALISYANSAKNGFVIDDEVIVKYNPDAASLSRIKATFSSHYWSNKLHSYPPQLNDQQTTYLYRPITILSYALTADCWDSSARAHHIVNISLHAFNSLLVFLAVWLWGRSLNIGGLTGLIFAIHPIHVDAVNLLVGRSELLSFSGVFLAIIALQKSLDNKRKFVWRFISCTAWFLALCSKETAALFVPLAALLIFCFRNEKERLSLQSLWPFGLRFGFLMSFYIIPFGIYLFLRGRAIGSALGFSAGVEGDVNVTYVFNPIYHSPFIERCIAGIAIMGKYLLLHVWPYPLLVDYSYDSFPIVRTPWNIYFWISFTAIMILLTWAYKERDKDRYYLIGILFWLTGIFLSSNIPFKIGTIFGERIMYIPSFGFCLAMATLIDRGRNLLDAGVHRTQRGNFMIRSMRATSYGIAVTTLIMSIVYCWRCNVDYRDTITALTSTIEQGSGRSAWQWYEVGKDHFVKGQLQSAIDALKRSVEIYPIDDAYDLMAYIYFELQDWENSIAAAKRAVELTENWWPYRKQLAFSLMQVNHFQEAAKQLEIALTYAPDDSLLHMSLGYLRKKEGNLSSAEAHYRAAMVGNNPQPSGFKALGDIYSEQGRVKDAIAAYQNFLRISPDSDSTKVVQEKLSDLLNKE
jgi:protein O-mannosyl-transferase